MNEIKRGGHRKGAGRKPSLNPKEIYTLYIEKKTSWAWGGKEKLKEAIYNFVSGKQVLPSELPQKREPVVVYEEPKLSALQSYLAEIDTAESSHELESIVKISKNDSELGTGDRAKVELAAQSKGKNLFY